GATCGPGCVKVARTPESGAVSRSKLVKQEAFGQSSGGGGVVAAPATTIPVSGESIVKSTSVMPRASALRFVRYLFPSGVPVENGKTIVAHPPVPTVPDRQTLPVAGSGLVRCAVVAPGGGFLVSKGHSATRPPQ